jgi:hypothetical protein
VARVIVARPPVAFPFPTIAGTGTVNAPSGGEWGGRTPTRYVAPFASVSGASNDYADLGATSYNNATSSGTPTTYGTALARATAGQIIGVFEGVYTLNQNPANNQSYNIPVTNPTNSGTSGNPIVFQARWPACYDSVTSGNRSKIQNNVTTGDLGVATIGATGRNYVVTDGFWVDENTSRSRADAGPAVIWNGTGLAMRRCRIDGIAVDRSGDNHPGIRGEELVTGEIYSNVVTGFTFGGSVNQCGIQFFECLGVTCYNNDVDNCVTGIYVKDDNSSFGFGGIDLKYNIVRNCAGGILVNDPSVGSGAAVQNYIEQNLIYDCSAYAVRMNFGGFAATPKLWTVRQNTMVDTVQGMSFNFQQSGALASSDFRNNLMSGTGHIFYFDAGTVEVSGYVANGMTATYNSGRGMSNYARTSGGNLATSANMVSAVGMGANGTISGQSAAQVFLSPGTDDYHLNVGSFALTAGNSGGPIGCYITGSETIGPEQA